MDIAALSVIMNHGQVQQQVDVAVLKMAMEGSEINMDTMLQALEQSVSPHLGQSIDVRV